GHGRRRRADDCASPAHRRTRHLVAGGDRNPGHLCRTCGPHRGRRPAAQDRMKLMLLNCVMAGLDPGMPGSSPGMTTLGLSITEIAMSEAKWQPLERDALAARLAQDIPEGWSVNLGIGIPTLVGNYVPPEREVIFHSENGILGMGPAPPPEKINRWLINASSQYVTLRPGASYMSHSDSFALVRGGHLDLCVLGAFQV